MTIRPDSSIANVTGRALARAAALLKEVVRS
jgi:hypothetical protein